MVSVSGSFIPCVGNRQNRGLNLWDIGATFLQTLILRQVITIRRHRYGRRTLRVLEEALIQDLSEPTTIATVRKAVVVMRTINILIL